MSGGASGRVQALQEERTALFVAQGACSGCEYASHHCHAARQRVMDRRGIGRHTSCAFFLEFRQQERPAPAPTSGSWWRPLLAWWR
ncbi:MAG TPA: hypothetical protein VF615_25715 [Longimicrobiaceae bacterium]